MKIIRDILDETGKEYVKNGFKAAFKKFRRAIREEVRIARGKGIIIKESALAKKYCTGSGLEIGGSAGNPFNLNTRNVDFTSEMTDYKRLEMRNALKVMPVDIVAPGDAIPLPDASQDFIVNSHVLEHFFDPIKALLEWYRLIRPGGVIFMIIPHRDRTFDSGRQRTKLQELIGRHDGSIKDAECINSHYSVWLPDDLVELVFHMNRCGLFRPEAKLEAVQDPDDKAGNGFTIVLRK